MPLSFIYNFFCHNTRLSIIALLLLPFFSFSQSKKQGSIGYLGASNGFNGITLGSDISQLQLTKLQYLDNNNKIDADSCLLYEYKNIDTAAIGNDIRFDLIGFRTYKNRIVNIYVFFNRADGYKVLRDFLKDYGLFTSKPADYVDIYDWTSSNVNLSLKYELKVDLGVAIFTSNKLTDDILTRKYETILSTLQHLAR